MAEKVNMPSQKKEMKKKRKKKLPSDFYDYNLLACTILLVSFGLIMLYSASAYEAASTFKGNDMYYFTHQAGLSAIVLVGIVILSKFVDYHSVWFQRIAALVYWGSLLLMAAVRFTPLGYEAYGARRWLRIGGVSLQPAEIGKLGLILYAIYFVMTVIETILLCAGGMPLFDALIHAFGTAGTGGFSNKALSVGAYNSPYFEIVIGVFMLLFGINFNLYYFLLLRHFREAFASEEMHVYLGIVAFSTLTITANIASMYDSVGTALRTAFFQVSSIVTTTGYATADFNLWPTYSRIVIVILTFVGACAGSTAGGLKVSRVIILFKAARQDLNKMLHSHAVTTVRFEGKPLDEKTLRGVHNYFNIYMLLLTLSVLLLSLDGFDLVTTFTSVATCLNNVGPGLEMVGPMGSFADFSAPAKLLLAFDMLAGRLELYPMLALFAPRLWRKRINAMHEARAK